ncbi:hypothetical protein [Arthrobacter pigmenti]
MAIPTTLNIKYTCGHTQGTDLSHIPAGRRKAHAYGLAKNKDCTKCFAKKNEAGRQQWLQQRNAQTLAEAEVFEQTHELAPVEGSEKQIPWATRVRYELLKAAMDSSAVSETTYNNSILPAARTIVKASWWITNSDTAAEDVEEIVTTAPVTEHIETENPF